MSSPSVVGASGADAVVTRDAPPAPDRFGLRSLAVSLLLVALAMTQSAGLLTADTKLDLAVDPAGMLRRAWSMWDPLGAFGQVGNQAYGYFWPMGPFFTLGHAVDVPMWVVQRCWMALVLVVAFQGVVRLARALGTRSDLAVIVAGLAYALSPRLLTTVGPISIEAWPSALAPWVLLCLVRGSQDRSPRLAALGAALATAMVGGVNAAATFAVVPLGALWLLTREPGPRRRTMLLWWPVLTVLACVWWLVPLVILGRYSPPFLDYIETADVTTYPTTLFNALRGTSDWIPYVDARWRAGNDLITTPIAILNSTVVVAVGLLGLSRRDQPQRTFLVLGLLTGLVMVTAGHLTGHGGWFAEPLHHALDGVLSPLRNVHKFDPVVRLPLVLGLGHVLDTAVRSWRSHPQRGRTTAAVSHFGVAGVCLVALVGSVSPALAGRLAPGQAFAGVPDYWQQAAAWVGAHGADERTLLAPGSAFGTYVWGDTRDEPMQPLARAPWAVRNAIPLAPTGNIRALDAVGERLDRGEGSAGLADYLHRMGVSYLLVRNDLKPSASVTDPVLVHQALRQSPGLVRVTAFGPTVGGAPDVESHGRRLTVNGGWQTRYRAVEVYAVQAGAEGAVTTSDAPVVIGAPEDLLTLADERVLADRPSVLGYDADTRTAPTGPVVLTDGMRLRDRFFGQAQDGTSPTLSKAEAARLGSARRDFVLTTDPRWSTYATYRGARDVTASSSASDAHAAGGARTADLPYAAVDSDPQTDWVSDPGSSKRPSLTLHLDGSRSVSSVTLLGGVLPGATSSTQEVVVRTARGASAPTFLDSGVATTVGVPAGSTSWVRVEAAPGAGGPLALAEVQVPGVSVTRWLVPPAVPTPWGAPDVISLDALADERTGCAEVDLDVRCTTGRGARDGEEASGLRRILRLPTGASYRLAAQALPRPGSAVGDLLQRGSFVHVDASSQAGDGAAAAGPLAAVDGDDGTTWTAAADDEQPSLDLSWLGRRTVTSLQLTLDSGAAARRPTRATVSYSGGSQQVRLDANGHADLSPVRVSGLSVRITGSEPTADVSTDGIASAVGVGVSEVVVGGVPGVTHQQATAERDYGCGSGPALRVDGTTQRTAVVASPRSLFLGRPVDLRPCDSATVDLPASSATVELGATPAFSPASVLLTKVGGAPVADALGTAAAGGHGTYRTAPGADTLVLRQNENPGWTATAHGRALRPVTLDGWQQGFRLPDGTTSVRTSYAPQQLYRLGLVVGGALLLLEVLLWLWWRRRPRAGAQAPLGEARSARVVTTVLCLLGAGVLCGTAGLLAAAVGGGVLLLVRQPALRVGLALLPLAVTGGWYAVQAWGAGHGWAGTHLTPQLLTVTSLSLLVVTAGGAASRGRQRIAGTSTNR